MHLLTREPVMLVSGVISAALVALLAFGVTLPEGIEGTLQAAVVAVAALLAAWKVRTPGQPTVVVGGLVSALVMLLATFGIELGEETATTIQSAVVLIVSWLVRDRVTPEEPVT